MYRTIVVGRGLIGSAAARHLSGLTDGIALLGPEEPTDRASHAGVFASHYDEGRMTRVVDPDPAWAITAKRSIERYPEIESVSGVRFFTNSQYLGLGPAQTPYIAQSEAIGRELGADIRSLDPESLRKRFPFLAVDDAWTGLHEGNSAGHLSPRAMVRAQSLAAERQGATILAAQASRVELTSNAVEVTTETGEVYRADRVLVAAGAFTEVCGLSPVDLGLRVFGRTVVLARIDEQLAEELNGMPTIGHAESGAYILPPIAYPDGQTYVKIGIGTTADANLDSLSRITDWFKSQGSDANAKDFRSFITALIPPLERCRNWHTDTCAVTWTATGLPYIDHVADDRIAVAVGGNGKGAKSADDWGWIAAHLIAGVDWEHPVARERLRVPTSGSR